LERVIERGGLPGSHRARGGLGLGLHLCRLIVERSFGGEIGVVRSGPDGTMVTFTVPVEASATKG
jgi:signal transduction histidine kinase